MDEKDKKEKYIKFLFELAELPEAFMGLQVLFPIFSLLKYESTFMVVYKKYNFAAVHMVLCNM